MLENEKEEFGMVIESLRTELSEANKTIADKDVVIEMANDNLKGSVDCITKLTAEIVELRSEKKMVRDGLDDCMKTLVENQEVIRVLQDLSMN